jgi:hypothetical protein
MYPLQSEYDRQHEALQGLRDRLLLAPRNDYEHCITKNNNTVSEATTYRCLIHTHQPEDPVALPLSVLILALLALRHLQAENTCDDIGAETESSTTPFLKFSPKAATRPRRLRPSASRRYCSPSQRQSPRHNGTCRPDNKRIDRLRRAATCNIGSGNMYMEGIKVTAQILHVLQSK